MPAFIIEILINFYAWVRNTTINVCLLAQIVCPFGNSCFVFFVFLDSGFNHSWEILLEITGNSSHACRINLKLFFLSFYELLKMVAQKKPSGPFSIWVDFKFVSFFLINNTWVYSIFFLFNFFSDRLFVGFVIRFFHPRHNGQWPPTSNFGMTRSLTGDWIRNLLHSKPALYH